MIYSDEWFVRFFNTGEIVEILLNVELNTIKQTYVKRHVDNK
jgi:hypothetical protein